MAELHKARAYFRLAFRASEAVYTHRVQRLGIERSEPLVHYYILRDKVHALGGKQLRNYAVGAHALTVEDVFAVTVFQLVEALSV